MSNYIWHDEAAVVPDDVWGLIEGGYQWGPDGFGSPGDGFWRAKTGDQVNISTMKDSYLLNCIRFLENKFGNTEVRGWRIYQNLMNEAIKRGIDDRTEWDV